MGKYREQVVDIISKRTVPTEVFKACGHIYWLNEVEAADIEDAVKFMWGFAEINNYKLTHDDFRIMVRRTEEGCRHYMEKFNPEIVSELDVKKRHKSIEMLINMVCDAKIDANYVYLCPADITQERIDALFDDEKYENLVVKYKSANEIYVAKMWERCKAGEELDDIHIDMEDVNKEYKELQNIKDRRKKNRDIEMIDADTKEVIYTFTSRDECMEQTGISKSSLSQCLSSTKTSKNYYDPYDGWKKWKDKGNGKWYYFREEYKKQKI